MRTGCEIFDPVLRAFAVGLLDPEGERYGRVAGHLRDCSDCRREVMILRGIASIVQPFPALFGLSSAAGSTRAGRLSREDATARRGGRGA